MCIRDRDREVWSKLRPAVGCGAAADDDNTHTQTDDNPLGQWQWTLAKDRDCLLYTSKYFKSQLRHRETKDRLYRRLVKPVQT